jgi:hypothetical protein
VLDPDLALPVFEVPIANRDNLQCLHYPHPQTGQRAFPPPAAGECPPRPPDAVLAAADGAAPGSGPAAGGAPATAAPAAVAAPPRRARGGVLADTGAQAALPLLALVALGTGLALRRRRALP